MILLHDVHQHQSHAQLPDAKLRLICGLTEMGYRYNIAP